MFLEGPLPYLSCQLKYECYCNIKKLEISMIMMNDVIMIEQRQQTSSKRLRFAEYSSLLITEQKSDKEMRDVWYTKQDIAKFKKNAMYTSKALRKTKTAKVSTRCAYDMYDTINTISIILTNTFFFTSSIHHSSCNR